MALGHWCYNSSCLDVKLRLKRIPHKFFYKLIAFEQTVGTLLASLLVEGLHLVRFDARIVDAEGYGFVGMRAMGNGCWMVGKQRN